MNVFHAYRACERHSLRILAYVFVLTMLGGFIGASTNVFALFLVGMAPGIGALLALMVGAWLEMRRSHYSPYHGFRHERAALLVKYRRLTLSLDWLGLWTAFATAVVGVSLLNMVK
jgi:hypothetical protein